MCSRTLQNFSFHPWLLENIGAQTIHQGYWSLHVFICLCRPLHNLHLLLKDEHCWSGKTTRWPIPRTHVCDIERNEKTHPSHCLIVFVIVTFTDLVLSLSLSLPLSSSLFLWLTFIMAVSLFVSFTVTISVTELKFRATWLRFWATWLRARWLWGNLTGYHWHCQSFFVVVVVAVLFGFFFYP